MSRLIDADAFEKFIKEKYKDGESTDDIKDQMLFDLSYQPTVYDVEKVVADLKELYERNDRRKRDCYENGNWEGFEIYSKLTNTVWIAIEIVRKGGAE